VVRQYTRTLVSRGSHCSVKRLMEHHSTEFISPAAVRSAFRRQKGGKYNYRKDAEEAGSRRKEARKRGEDELAVSKVFA
jgi:ribosome biogenesis protein BRX1